MTALKDSSQDSRCYHSTVDLACGARKQLRLEFELPAQLNYGEFHKIVGGHPSLGDWNVDAAPQMAWSDGDTWSTDVHIPAGQQIEFKVGPSLQTSDS